MLVRLAAEAGVKNPGALADALRLRIDGAVVAAHATGSNKPARVARVAAASLLQHSERIRRAYEGTELRDPAEVGTARQPSLIA